MPLPAYPNSISLSQIQAEYGGSNPISLSEYYTNSAGPVYPGQEGFPNGNSAVVPASGQISLGAFSGSTKYTPQARTVTLNSGSGTWTVPSTLIGNLTVKIFGGGGGGGYNSWGPGGGGGGGAYWSGSIPAGTAIAYSVGGGGAYRVSGGATSWDWGTGRAWQMYAGGGVAGSGATGGAGGVGSGGNVQGTGGKGQNRDNPSTWNTGNAVNYGGGGGTRDGDGAGAYGQGYGAGGGGNGGYSAGGAAQNGTFPAGGGAGNDQSGSGGAGASGQIVITGTW